MGLDISFGVRLTNDTATQVYHYKGMGSSCTIKPIKES